MIKNLEVTQFRNGDPILEVKSDEEWQQAAQNKIPAWCFFDNDPNKGKLYNWFATVDSRGLCPNGWHVPTDCEWMYLEGSIGMTVVEQEQSNVWRGSGLGGKLKGLNFWYAPNTGATDEFGFSAIPGGDKYLTGEFYNQYMSAQFSSSTFYDSEFMWSRIIDYNRSDIARNINDKNVGFSVRCIKDENAAPIQGCTDGAACNFLANANQDDGSCLYQNTSCDDGNANTTNDVINGECVCEGTQIVNGCTNPQACNYNSAANVDNGSCLLQGTACDDGNSSTNDDTISSTCQCLGIFNVPIGQDYLGGKLAYVFQPGDIGYIPGETHGLIAAPQDLPNDQKLGCYGISISGADGSAIGTGQQNTIDAINCGGGPFICSNLYLNGYDDWFLPSIGELAQLYANKDQIGGFDTGWGVYLSSTESNIYYVQIFRFSIGDAAVMAKDNIGNVRPVRMF